MTPVKKSHTNLTLKPPSDWNEDINGPCRDLHATRSEGVFYTYWTFSFIERLKIMFGVELRLSIMSEGFPPVSLEITDK